MSAFVVSRPSVRFLVRQPIGSEHEVDVVPGLRHDMVQCFDLMVAGGASVNLYCVVVASSPELSEHDRAVIAQALSATRRPELAFLTADTPKGASVECDAKVDARATAAAVAVVRASLGTGAENPRTLSVNDRTWTVSVQNRGAEWHSQVEPMAAASE